MSLLTGSQEGRENMEKQPDSKKMLDLILGNANSDGRFTVVELSYSKLQQLSLLEAEHIKGLMLLCIKSVNISDDNQGYAVEAGESYRVLQIYNNTVTFLSKTGGRCALNFNVIYEVFALQVEEVRAKALETTIQNMMSDRAALLKKLASAFLDTQTFKLGDPVTWKPGFKNCVYPYLDDIGVVVEILDPPITHRATKEEQALASGGSINDVVIAFLNSEGEFEHFLMDSRRFTKV